MGVTSGTGLLSPGLDSVEDPLHQEGTQPALGPGFDAVPDDDVD